VKDSDSGGGCEKAGLSSYTHSLRVTVTLKNFGQRPINGASILVDRTRSKQLVHTSQNRPSFCALYWVTTFSIGKTRLWLAERAKSRGSHGGAPETGFIIRFGDQTRRDVVWHNSSDPDPKS